MQTDVGSSEECVRISAIANHMECVAEPLLLHLVFDVATQRAVADEQRVERWSVSACGGDRAYERERILVRNELRDLHHERCAFGHAE